MNKVAVITGVSAGIGRALVDEFIKQGFSVAGMARSTENIQELNKIYGDKHLFISGDVADYKVVQEFAQSVHNKLGNVDVLFNNAGVKSQLRPLWEVTEEDFNRTINTNLMGVANMIRAFVPQMVASKTGLIVNMSSEWGRVTDPKVGSYCASKFAVEGLTHSLAKDLPQGVITVALSPFVVKTQLLENVRLLLLPGEYEMSVAVNEWAHFAVPKLLALSVTDNGKSITIAPAHVEYRDIK